MSDAHNDLRDVNARNIRRLRHPHQFKQDPLLGAKEDFMNDKSMLQEVMTATEPIYTSGNKLDNGKPKISLIPSEAITEMAVAFTYGANKYAADNFKGGISYRRLLDASFRHLLAISNGEDVDSESGNSHVGHALASLAMLTYMMKNKPHLDDRYKDK